ncbi:MAG: HDIG domain-containing protein [Myxococcales bacterium]|nr:HDIG domain-containing protein [Myxococcales bacterium]
MNTTDPRPPSRWRQAVSVLGQALRRYPGWRRLGYRAFLLGLVLLLSAVVAILVNPGTSGPAFPVSEEDIGKVAGSDIRAPVSFSVPDVEATERKRREAEEAVRSVYDFEQNLLSERIGRVRRAFGLMRALLEEPAADGGPLDSPEEPLDGGGGDGEAGRRRRARALPGAETAEPAGDLDALLDRHKDAFIQALQTVIRDEDWNRLREARFSDEVRDAVIQLLQPLADELIVSRRELLGAERGRGIHVRYLRDGVPEREAVLNSLVQILDTEEVWVRIERAAEELELPVPLRACAVRLARGLVAPSLAYNYTETELRRQEAREAVGPLEIRIKKGAKIIRDGDLIEKKHILVFQELRKHTEVSNEGELFLGTVLLVALMLWATGRFSVQNIRKFRSEPRHLLLLAALLLVMVLSIKVWFWIFGAVWEQFRLFPLESYYYAIPFAAGAMLVRFVLNSEMALAFTLVASLLSGLLMENNIGYSLYCLASSLTAAGAVGQVSQRSSLLRAGVLTGFANVAAVVGLTLLAGSFLSIETLFSAIFAWAGGILVAIIVTGTAPVIETVFGYTTDVKLMELANLNHPLLKELIVEAPGSYHHSIIVGSLVEAAAESIHCNPLLAKVMAYYHDIGKIKNPAYFSENQREGVNRHDRIKPSLSAMVLKAHVKDGAELARTSKLGQPIVDAILQHHGTSLIKYFYQKAKEQEDAQNPVDEREFRYLGPKPRTREVALVMLADAVEAAAKSIEDPSPSRLQGLVQNLINRIFVDGQLEECDLTLRDLHEIARAFNRVLVGIYHSRPDYPEPATKERGPETKNGTPPPAGDKPRGEASTPEELHRLGM